MRISRILAPITSLGPGRRVGLWVQGCDLACPGCASTDTWDASAGHEVDTDVVAQQLVDRIKTHRLTGLTVSGGEPFQQPDDLADVIDQVRGETSDLDVLVFTGYQPPIARKIGPRLWNAADALAAGRYDRTLPAGGSLLASSNQRLVVRTELGRARHNEDHDCAQLQVAADSGDLYVVGLPRAGDLDRLASQLQRRGIDVGGVSWQP